LMVRKGEAVGFSIHAMHRLKRIYGEDAHSFRPDRWDPDMENAVDLKKVGWGYLPFGGGPRLCLGRKSSKDVDLCPHMSLTDIQRSLHCLRLAT
jgi:cytochrome P450